MLKLLKLAQKLSGYPASLNSDSKILKALLIASVSLESAVQRTAVKSTNCDVIISFPRCGQSREVEKPDFGRMVCVILTFPSILTFCLKKPKAELKNL